MKVALVMEWIEPSRGGAETSTHQFIQHLLARGIRLEVITRSHFASGPDLKVHTVAASGPTRTGRSAAFARAADRMTGKLDVRLVHAISPCLRADVYEPRGGTVVETIARNLALRSSTARRSLKKLANRFNLRQRLMLDLEGRLLSRRPPPTVIALSDYVVRQLREHYDFPETCIRRIFNGVDPDPADDHQRRADRSRIREQYEVAGDQLLAILVAHNFKLKGVARWIEALSLLARDGPAVTSLVIGKGHAARWQRQAAKAGVADRVRFVGASDKIAAFYHAADLLVHPTYYDPCSRVVLEGMVSGLPCVTTRFDGASDAIEDGVNGFVIEEPEAVDALADRVRRLADSDLRSRMGEQAAKVADQVSMQAHAARTVELYEELAGGRRRVSL